MKNKKFAADWSKLSISEETENRILNKIQQKLQTQKNRSALKLKPAIITAVIFIMLATTVAAAAPFILKMIGSDIGFFESDKQTRYSADYELIKQYSSEVGIIAEGDGFSFTVDNIAYDGTFMSVFYTIKKEANIREETIVQTKKWNSSWKASNDKFIARGALWNNEIYFEIPGYIERPSIEEYIGANPGDFMHDTLKYPISDGYFVSDYEPMLLTYRTSALIRVKFLFARRGLTRYVSIRNNGQRILTAISEKFD